MGSQLFWPVGTCYAYKIGRPREVQLLVPDGMLANCRPWLSSVGRIRRAFLSRTFAIKVQGEQRIMAGRSKRQKPPHPGHVLKNALANRSIDQAAKRFGISREVLSQIMRGQAGITSEVSLKLAEACKTSPSFWLNLQANHDAWRADREHR